MMNYLVKRKLTKGEKLLKKRRKQMKAYAEKALAKHSFIQQHHKELRLANITLAKYQRKKKLADRPVLQPVKPRGLQYIAGEPDGSQQADAVSSAAPIRVYLEENGGEAT